MGQGVEMNTEAQSPELINIHQIIKMTTLSRATIYRLIKAGDFPEGHMITKGRRVWKKNEVETTLNQMLS